MFRIARQATALSNSVISPTTVTHARADADAIHKISDILTKGIEPSLLRQGQTRTVVSSSTYERLSALNNSLTTLPKDIPPYQRPHECETQGINIVFALGKESKEKQKKANLSKSTDTAGIQNGGIWESLKKIFVGTFNLVHLKNKEHLLELYSRHGPFVLRAPGLGEQYLDHAIPVTAVVSVPNNNGESKIVLCTLDCNDAAENAATQASSKLAKKLGKNHISELSQEQARQNGADRERIRLIDADVLFHPINRSQEKYASHQIEFCNTKIKYVAEGIAPLPERDIRDLSALIAEIYDGEDVEKYNEG